MGNQLVQSTQTQKDFGVTVSYDLKTMAHFRDIAAKQIRTLWDLRWIFTKLDSVMFTTVYKFFVSTKLGNWVQGTNPRLKGDSNMPVQFQNSGFHYTKSG